MSLIRSLGGHRGRRCTSILSLRRRADLSLIASVIPETKGLSLEQVDLLYRSGLKPAKMGAFRRQILSEDLVSSARRLRWPVWPASQRLPSPS